MTGPPIRIQRKGMWRWFSPTRDEMRRACLFAESEARAIIWVSVDHLVGYLVQHIGDQLSVPITAEVAGWHGESDLPVIAIYAAHYTHHVAVRDTHINELVEDVEPVAPAMVAAPAPAKKQPQPSSDKFQRIR